MDTDGHGYQAFAWNNEFTQQVPGPDPEIRNTTMKLSAFPTRIWSAVTCRRFRCLAGLPAKQSRVQRLGGRTPHPCPLHGDQSPAKSADKSAHSKALWLRHQPRWVYLGASVVKDFFIRLQLRNSG